MAALQRDNFSKQMFKPSNILNSSGSKRFYVIQEDEDKEIKPKEDK